MLAMVSSNRLDLPKTNRHKQSFYIQYCIQSIGPKRHLVFNRSIQHRSLNFFSLFAQAVPCSLDLFNAQSLLYPLFLLHPFESDKFNSTDRSNLAH